jgi:hypothetical protein
LGIDFIICFTCVILWVGVDTWVLVVKLVDNNNQDYARIDKSKGEDFCSGTNCYGKATQKRLEESPVNPNTVVTIVNKKNSLLVSLSFCWCVA